MASFGEIATGVGAIAQGASSLFGAFNSLGSAKRQKKMMKFQYDQEEKYQKKMAEHNWDHYNSPAAQRRAMKAAGINPFAGDSSIAGMQMGANSTGPDLQEAADPGAGFSSNMREGATSLIESQMALTNMRNIEAQTSLTRAQEAKVKSETIAQDNENSMFDITSGMAQLDFLSKSYRVELDRVAAEWAEIDKIQDSAEKAARIADLRASTVQRLQDAARTYEDRQTLGPLRKALTRMYETQADENVASTGLIGSQQETEDKLRDGRVDLQDAEYKQALTDLDRSEIQLLQDAFNATMEATGNGKVTTYWQLVSEIKNFVSRRTGGSYSNAVGHAIDGVAKIISDRYLEREFGIERR